MAFENLDQNGGYSFFRKLGSPKTVVAPMVDQSELAYRMLVRRYGAQLVYTQMFNANCFVTAPDYRRENFSSCPEDRPLIVQFAGHDPLTMLKAAKMVEDHCDAVDINIGCPQGIAKRGRYGAWLMEELDLLAEMVRTLSQNLKIPVTCKTRIYKDFDRSIRLCETLVNAGASLLCIHGRTREEKGHLVREADWEMIRRIKEHFKGRVPIIANGGISSLEDVEACLQYTGCDAVMSSEGVLENPSLFASFPHSPHIQLPPSSSSSSSSPSSSSSSTSSSTSSPLILSTRPNQLELTYEYLLFCQSYPPYHIKTVRSHVMKLLHRYLHFFPPLRTRAATAHSVEEFLILLEDVRVVVGERESQFTHSWYRRHRDELLLSLSSSSSSSPSSSSSSSSSTDEDDICNGGIGGGGGGGGGGLLGLEDGVGCEGWDRKQASLALRLRKGYDLEDDKYCGGGVGVGVGVEGGEGTETEGDESGGGFFGLLGMGEDD